MSLPHADHEERHFYVPLLQDDLTRELEHRLLHHLEEEEREVFQLAGKVLSEEQKTDLAQSYRSAMQQARREAHQG